MAEDLTRTAEQLAARLTPADLDETLRQITAAAVAILPNAQYASISVLHADGRLVGVAPTDDVVVRLDEEQDRLREGPCYFAAKYNEHVVSSDLRSDERFAAYGRVAADLGIRSQVGLALFSSDRAEGALNLYSGRVGAFDDHGSVREFFVHQAGQAIRYAQQIDNLQQALTTRRLIGQATGMVMERYDLSEERAFAFLQRLSQDNNVKLRDVAATLVGQRDRGPSTAE